MALIFGLSSIPSLAGPDLGFQNVDKLYHCLEYGSVAILVFRALAARPMKLSSARNFTLMIMPLIACLDEFYQGFVPGRFSDVTDALADCVGSIIGVLILWWWLRRRKLAE